MDTSLLAKWSIAASGLVFALYGSVVGSGANDNAGSFFFPYSWVWVLVLLMSLLLVTGLVLSVVAAKKTSATPAPAPAPAPVPVPVPARISVPWTQHVDLNSHRDLRTGYRRVEWASNGRAVGELRPSANGGGFDVFDTAGVSLGDVVDEKAGMELLKSQDTRAKTSLPVADIDARMDARENQADLLRRSFGEYPTNERGKPQNESLQLLEQRLPAARKAADEVAKALPVEEVKDAVDRFKAAWTRVLTLDDDVDRYLEDKQDPNVMETKKTIEHVWNDAAVAFDVVSSAVKAHRAGTHN